MSWADEIRARVDIADVVSEYSRLKPSGPGKHVCLSPFKQETRPSFNIDSNKGVWYCFSTKQGGDIVKFIMTIENLEFREALEFLGHKYGIPDPGMKKGGKRAVRAEGREALYKSCEAAASFYHNILLNTSMGKGAKGYLEKRGISDETIKKFKLGATTSGWDTLSNELLKKGARENDLIAAGLSHKKRDGTGLIDAFRNRLMFPISNSSGRIIAFGGRALDDHPAKYINSSNSAIYNKSNALYGLSAARRAISEHKFVILVEGYMDVLALVQAGFENVIATCGTAMTEEHLRIVFRHTKDIVISMDGDDAGRDAAIRTAGIILRARALPRIIAMPEKTDPDDFIKSEGADAYRKRVEEATDPVTFLLDHLGVHASATSREKEAWIETLKPIVRAAPELVRDDFIRTIAGRLGIDQKLADALIGYAPRARGDSVESTDSSSRELLRNPRLKIEAGVLAAIIHAPNLLNTALEYLIADDFSIPAARATWDIVSKGGEPETWDAAILELGEHVEGIGELYGILTDKAIFPHQQDFMERVKRLIGLKKKKAVAEIERAIADAESDGDWERVSELAMELARLRSAE